MRTTRRLLVLGLVGLVPVLARTRVARAAGGNTYYVNQVTGVFPNPACASAANNPAAPFGDIGVALACVNGDGTTSATPDTINVAPSILYPTAGASWMCRGTCASMARRDRRSSTLARPPVPSPHRRCAPRRG